MTFWDRTDLELRDGLPVNCIIYHYWFFSHTKPVQMQIKMVTACSQTHFISIEQCAPVARNRWIIVSTGKNLIG